MRAENENKTNENSRANRASSQKRITNKKNADYPNEQDGAGHRRNMHSGGQNEFIDFTDDSYVKCEDHLNKLSQDEAAERYCLKCKTAVCSSCIIDYHSSHIQDAKTKIDDFIISQRKEVESLKPLIFTSINKNEILDSINKYYENQNVEFSKYIEKRKEETEKMKNNLDKILALESRIISELKEKSEGAYNEMYDLKLKGSIEKANIVSLEILKLIEAWDKISKQEKMNMIKKNQINILKQDANLKRTHLSLEVEITKGNVINIIDYIKNYRTDLAKNTLTDGIEIEINNIYMTLKESFGLLEKTEIIKLAKNIPSKPSENNTYRSSVPEKQKINFEDGFGKSSNANSNSYFNKPTKNSLNNFTKDGDEKKDENKINNFNRNLHDKPFGNSNSAIEECDDISINTIPNNSIVSILTEHDSTNSPFSKAIANNFGCEFFIGIKPGFKDIKVFDPKAHKIFNFNLSNSMFQDKSVTLEDFMNNCRYVNLGFSALITGGLVNAFPVTNSYLLVVSRVPSAQIGADNSLQISMMSYSSMNDSRERHCMINLTDKNKVLICSGFLKKTVEITNMSTGVWTSVGALAEIRANATGAYINNRYAYIFGGFKLENGKGVYNNSAEILDLNTENSTWKFIDFENKYSNNNIKITAAGVLHYSNEKILLCGGYNGQVYLKDVYCIEHSEDKINVYEKTKLNLADELIFFHSSFVKCGGSAVNFDYKMDLNVYNPLTKEFKIYK